MADSKSLDSLGPPQTSSEAQISSAAFVDEERVVLSSDPGSEPFDDEGESPFRPGTVAVFHLESGRFESVTTIDQPVGQMMWLGDGRVVGFYEHPKVIDAAAGTIVCRWPEIKTGKQSSSIIYQAGELPPLAGDPMRKRFAVASAERVVVLQF